MNKIKLDLSSVDTLVDGLNKAYEEYRCSGKCIGSVKHLNFNFLKCNVSVKDALFELAYAQCPECVSTYISDGCINLEHMLTCCNCEFADRSYKCIGENINFLRMWEECIDGGYNLFIELLGK